MDYSDSLFSTICMATIAGVGVSYLFQRIFAPQKPKPWPLVPGALPIIGNRIDLKYLVTEVKELIVKYGNVPSNKTGFLEINVLGNPLLLVCNNQIAAELIKLRPNKVRRPASGVEAIHSMGGDGVFNSHGEIWTKDRRMFAPPLMNQKNLKDYLPVIRTVTNRLIEKWRDASASIIAINQDILSYTIDNISLVAFDQDMDCLRNPHSQQEADLRKLFQLLLYRSFSPIRYWRFPVLGQYLDMGAFCSRRIQSNIQNVIRSFQTKEGGRETRGQQTYLEKILCQPDFTPERIMGNLITMFAAGADTTGNTIMICLWEMLQEEQKVYYEELVEEALGLAKVDSISYDELMKGLPKLRAFFYEINRLKGTAPVVFLECSETVQVGGIEVPPGLEIYIDFNYLSTLEGSGIPNGPGGESSAEFCPRRWLSPSSDSTEWTVTKPSAKTGVAHCSGFGGGVRICPGQYLAELEVVYCLACLLQHFDLSLKPNHPPVKIVSNFTETPEIDIELVLRPR